jgi:hypothetical protein
MVPMSGVTRTTLLSLHCKDSTHTLRPLHSLRMSHVMGGVGNVLQFQASCHWKTHTYHDQSISAMNRKYIRLTVGAVSDVHGVRAAL